MQVSIVDRLDHSRGWEIKIHVLNKSTGRYAIPGPYNHDNSLFTRRLRFFYCSPALQNICE